MNGKPIAISSRAQRLAVNSHRKMARKKEIEIPKPLITRHCAKCGKWFIATHPKDPQKLCERCRKGVKSEK